MAAKLFSLLFCVVLLAQKSLANIPGCHVIVNTQSQHTSYQNGGVTNTPYNINIVNIGTCNVSSVYLNIDVSGSATLTQQTNLEQLDSSHFFVGNVDYLIPNGDYSGSGYVVGSNDLEASVIVTLATAICEDTGDCVNSYSTNGLYSCDNLTCDCRSVCIQDGGVPRCETVYENCPNQPIPCQATASIVARPQGFWYNSNGSPNQIYDITVQNSGQCTLTAVKLQINLASGQILIQTWNFDSSNNLTNFYQISPSSNFTGAGFIVQGAGAVSVSVQTNSCLSC